MALVHLQKCFENHTTFELVHLQHTQSKPLKCHSDLPAVISDLQPDVSRLEASTEVPGGDTPAGSDDLLGIVLAVAVVVVEASGAGCMAINRTEQINGTMELIITSTPLNIIYLKLHEITKGMINVP